MTRLSIDPNSLQLTGAEGAPYTADQLRRLELPTCPVCGATVDIDWIDVTVNAEQERRDGRRYMSGMWRCPRDCNPETGKRFHREQETHATIDGIWFRCSCGVETYVSAPSGLATLQEQHPLGQER